MDCKTVQLLANVRLGTMLRRGGTLWGDSFTGEYCQSYGYQRLALIRDRLSTETLAAALAVMRRAAAEPEDVAILRARSDAFSERVGGT